MSRSFARSVTPALVEWMGHGLLRARIFPLNPGDKADRRALPELLLRARATHLNWTISTLPRRAKPRWRDGGATSFTLSYRDAPDLGTPYLRRRICWTSPIATAGTPRSCGDARDVTLLVPM